MMLDNTSRKFLKILTSSTPSNGDEYFTIDFVAEKCGISENAALACMRYLENQDLVHVIRAEWSGAGGTVVWGLEATHKGYHHREFAVIDAIETAIKSVFIPILVALITALLIA